MLIRTYLQIFRTMFADRFAWNYTNVRSENETLQIHLIIIGEIRKLHTVRIESIILLLVYELHCDKAKWYFYNVANKTIAIVSLFVITHELYRYYYLKINIEMETLILFIGYFYCISCSVQSWAFILTIAKVAVDFIFKDPVTKHHVP